MLRLTFSRGCEETGDAVRERAGAEDADEDGARTDRPR